VDPLGAVGDGGVAEMGQHLAERMPAATAAKFGEVVARLAEPDATDADALESLSLLWPGYFADPAAAPPIPPDMRTSLECYRETFASVAEQLTGGLAEQLGEVRVPAVFVLGEQSPMPVTQGQQTAALLPEAEVVVVPGAGHLPWHEQPGYVATALAGIRKRAAGLDPA
jgi:proline iminopeptidase